MRTWSVSGTAFALCTRSSSLSMRTRTSMRSPESSVAGRGDGSFAGILGCAGLSVRELLGQPLRDGFGYQLVHLTPEGGDLFDTARRDEAHLRARHDVDRLDLGGEMAVQLVHLELPLEIRDDTQALHDRLGLPAPGELDHELGEDVDLDVVEAGEGCAEELDAFVQREERLLVTRGADDA